MAEGQVFSISILDLLLDLFIIIFFLFFFEIAHGPRRRFVIVIIIFLSSSFAPVNPRVGKNRLRHQKAIRCYCLLLIITNSTIIIIITIHAVECQSIVWYFDVKSTYGFSGFFYGATNFLLIYIVNTLNSYRKYSWDLNSSQMLFLFYLINLQEKTNFSVRKMDSQSVLSHMHLSKNM